jgi:hypothetical protein
MLVIETKKLAPKTPTIMKRPRASLKGLQAVLLVLIRTLHGSSLLENAGAYSPE